MMERALTGWKKSVMSNMKVTKDVNSEEERKNNFLSSKSKQEHFHDI